MTSPAPRRVVVTSPYTATAKRRRHVPASRELNEQTPLGEVLLASLVRAQLRLAVRVLGVFGLILLGLPLVFLLLPETRSTRVLGLPLPWFLLGVGIFPVLVIAAAVYVWAVARLERDFSQLVERS